MQPLTNTPHKASTRLATMLLRWLNSKTPDAHRERVATYIELLNALHRHRKAFDGAAGGVKMEKSRPVYSTPESMAWFLELQALNAELREIYPEFLSPSGAGWKTRLAAGSDFAARLLPVYQLAEQGALARVRRCAVADCKKWFFAKRRLDQRCCSVRCRKKLYGAIPSVKKQKAKYMQKYMAKIRKAGK